MTGQLDNLPEKQKDWLALQMADVFLAYNEMKDHPEWGEVLDGRAPEGYDRFKYAVEALIEEILDAL